MVVKRTNTLIIALLLFNMLLLSSCRAGFRGGLRAGARQGVRKGIGEVAEQGVKRGIGEITERAISEGGEEITEQAVKVVIRTGVGSAASQGGVNAPQNRSLGEGMDISLDEPTIQTVQIAGDSTSESSFDRDELVLFENEDKIFRLSLSADMQQTQVIQERGIITYEFHGNDERLLTLKFSLLGDDTLPEADWLTILNLALTNLGISPDVLTPDVLKPGVRHLHIGGISSDERYIDILIEEYNGIVVEVISIVPNEAESRTIAATSAASLRWSPYQARNVFSRVVE